MISIEHVTKVYPNGTVGVEDININICLLYTSTIKNSGKNVYVVSASGNSSWNTVRDGIRYINLPGLWTSSGNLNKDFKTLTIKADGSGMYYDIKSMF